MDVYCQVQKAGEEGQHSDCHTIGAGTLVLVENAALLLFACFINISFINYAPKNHNGKHPGHHPEQRVRLPDERLRVEGSASLAGPVRAALHADPAVLLLRSRNGLGAQGHGRRSGC